MREVTSTVYLQPSTSKSACISAFCPSSNSLTLAPASRGHLYFANVDKASCYDRTFLVETYQVFAGLQTLANLDQAEQMEAGAVPRIATLLRSKIIDQIQRSQANDESSETLFHLKRAFQTFYLCQILYLPAEEDRSNVGVGEAILHWVNTCDPAPSREQGLELASMQQPYDSDLFWSYLPRCVLRGLFKAALTLMTSLQEYPLPFIRKAARLTCHLLQNFPRSSSHLTLEDYTRQCLLYRRSVKETIRDLETEYDDDTMWSTPSKRKSSAKSHLKEDQRIEWYARFLNVLKLLAGDQNVILESAEDWKEALAACTLLVRPSATRDDLPEILDVIFQHESVNIDPDDELDAVQHALLLTHTFKAMSKCATYDIWLATHITDLLCKVDAIQLYTEDGITIKDWFILQYAERIMLDPGLWRIALHYLSFVGELGVARMQSILQRVAYANPSSHKGASESTMNGTALNSHAEGQQSVTTAEDVIHACYEYGLQSVAHAICRNVTDKLLLTRKYGQAVAYVVASRDNVGMNNIMNALLDEYLNSGQEEFARHVDTIPTRLLRPGSLDDLDLDEDTNSPTLGEKVSSLRQISFLAQYRDFHAFFAQDARLEAAKLLVNMLANGGCPSTFRAVLLLDSIPLLEDQEILFDAQDTFQMLRSLQEIANAANMASCLSPVARLLTRDLSPSTPNLEKIRVSIAEHQLQVVRLALARNLSRCFAIL